MRVRVREVGRVRGREVQCEGEQGKWCVCSCV